jgi:hypothetical protein
MSKTSPGLKRLPVAPVAESIRQSVLADSGKAEPRSAPRSRASPAPPQKPPRAAIRPPRPASPGACRKGRPARPPKASGKRAEILASAQSGVLPAPPDFTAETHRRFRAKLAEVVALVEAAYVEGLALYRHDAFIGSSMKAVMRYRDLALCALEARAAMAAAA